MAIDKRLVTGEWHALFWGGWWHVYDPKGKTMGKYEFSFEAELAIQKLKRAYEERKAKAENDGHGIV